VQQLLPLHLTSMIRRSSCPPAYTTQFMSVHVSISRCQWPSVVSGAMTATSKQRRAYQVLHCALGEWALCMTTRSEQLLAAGFGHQAQLQACPLTVQSLHRLPLLRAGISRAALTQEGAVDVAKLALVG